MIWNSKWKMQSAKCKVQNDKNLNYTKPHPFFVTFIYQLCIITLYEKRRNISMG